MRTPGAAGTLREARVLLLLEGGTPPSIIESARAAAAAGVQAVEVDAVDVVGALDTLVGAELGVLLGVGPLVSTGQVWEAIEAGARFVSADPLNAEMAAVCEAAGVLTVAEVGDAQGSEAALLVRPNFVRTRLSAASFPLRLDEGTRLIVELETADEEGVRAANLGGAHVVAVRERSLAATSPEDLHVRLAALVEWFGAD